VKEALRNIVRMFDICSFRILFGEAGSTCTSIAWPLLVFLPLFFLLWNSGCSRIILVPALRWYFFGRHDKLANNAAKAMICPHWLIGIIMPSAMAGVVGFFIAVLIPYLKVGLDIYKLCREEANHGLLIHVINEVDVFVDNKKVLRAIDVRRSKEGMDFIVSGKDYKSITLKGKTKIHLHVNDILTATTIYNFFTTKPQMISGSGFEKEYRFASQKPNHPPKQIMLKFTSYVGNESIAVAEAFLPTTSTNEMQPQTSLGNTLVRAMTGGITNSNEHFVATPLYFEPVDSRVAPTIATRV